MASILFKWFLLAGLVLPTPLFDNPASLHKHPFFISVTEIEHNATEKTLEISCKMFTDDFEKSLKKNNTVHIDLLNKKYQFQMEPLVNSYITSHLSVIADGKKVAMKFHGYEKQEESIVSYYQVENIVSLKKLEVFNTILYDYKSEQTGIVHAIVHGERQSSKITNPDNKIVFQF